MAKLAAFIAEFTPEAVDELPPGFDPVAQAGSLSGFLHAVGSATQSTVEMANDAAKFLHELPSKLELLDPDYVAKIVELMAEFWEHRAEIFDALKDAPAAVLESVEAAQNRHNPFASTSASPLSLPVSADGESYSDNATFARGWYTGFVGGHLLFAFVGDKAVSSIVKNGADVSDSVAYAVSVANRAERIAIDKTIGVSYRTSIRAAHRIHDAAPDLELARVRSGLQDLSVTAQRGVEKRLLEDLDGSTRGTIADDGLEAEAVGYLSVTGPSGTRLLDDLDEDRVRDYLRIGCRRGGSSVSSVSAGHLYHGGSSAVGSMGVATMTNGCGPGIDDGDLPNGVWHKLERAYADGKLSRADIEEISANTRIVADNGLESEFIRLLDDTGAIGARFATDLSSDDLQRFLVLQRNADVDTEDLHAFVLRTDGEGAELISALGEQRLERFFAVDGTYADQLREGLFTAWKRSDDVTDAHLERAVTRFDDLDRAEQRTFARLSSDIDLQGSWTRAAGAEGTDLQGVRKATERFEMLEADGHNAKVFKTGREANDNSVHQGGQPPHRAKGIVVEFEIGSPDRFVRVFSDSRSPGGPWMMKERDFDGLATREDVLDHFALSEDWQDYNRVAQIELGDEARGLRVQVSTTSAIDDVAAGVTRPGGGTQYFVLPERRAEGWEDLTSLDDYLKNT